jgi:hypothetical protein
MEEAKADTIEEQPTLPPSDLLDGVYFIRNKDDATKVAKKFVKLLKPYYWHKYNVTRERNYYVTWMGEEESGLVNADHILDVQKFYSRLIAEKFTESIEQVAARMNWTASDSARLAHVLMDPNCLVALQRLLQGSSRDEMDAGINKTASYDVFAGVFNDSDVVYNHPNPENATLAHMDPNNTSTRDRTALKLQQVFNSIRAKMTVCTAKYCASGNGGEIPFWNFCGGEATLLYWHLVWEDNSFYNALIRLIPGGKESGDGDTAEEAAKKRLFTTPTGEGTKGQRSSGSGSNKRQRTSLKEETDEGAVRDAEAKYLQSKTVLAEAELKSVELKSVNEKIKYLQQCMADMDDTDDVRSLMEAKLKELRVHLLSLC